MTENEMLKAELKKGPTPKRHWLVTAGVVLGVGVLAAGGAVGASALNDYRAEIAAETIAAQQYYDEAAEQNKLASQAADDAAQSAQDAQDAAAEADAAAATQAAAVAEEAATLAERAANGLTPEGKCPAGTVAGEVHEDGTEGLCAPTGPGGKTCAEYTDNVCTGWLKD